MYIKPFSHPSVVFKAMVDAEAEIEAARNFQSTPLPKYVKIKVRKIDYMKNLFKRKLTELRP